MENSIKISIVRPGKQTLKTEGISLQIPGYDGSIGIMHNRQPLVTLMDSGLICIKSFNGKKSYFAVSGGFAEIQDNVATLLCDSIITPEDLPEINMETTGVAVQIPLKKPSFNDEEMKNYLFALLRSKLIKQQ